jgi:hypothetical protein
MVHNTKGIKMSEKKQVDAFLDEYFIPTWLKKRLVDMFNDNSGENNDWRWDM